MLIFFVLQKNTLFVVSWSTLLWYRCFYPHQSRDALSPVRGIFKASALWADAFYKSICPYICVSACSLLRYPLTVFLPPLPKVGCKIFLEIRNPWGKVMERSGVTFKHFSLEVVKNCCAKNSLFFADFSLQNTVETTLPDGLETSGRRVYR